MSTPGTEAERPNYEAERPNYDDPKYVVGRYLDVAHEALLWKLDGLSEYDLRRPLTPTGTNMLGIAKHVAWVELGYMGEVFNRPHGLALPDNAGEVNADMYATEDESVEDIIGLVHTAWDHAKATLAALKLDAEGVVAWWGEAGNPVSLFRIVVHLTTEIHRHVGQMDILRENLDGAAGLRPDATGLPDGSGLPDGTDFWTSYCDRLEAIARQQAEPE